jgi:peptidoglycan/LPS O-acetylase OafA/YrhL
VITVATRQSTVPPASLPGGIDADGDGRRAAIEQHTIWDRSFSLGYRPELDGLRGIAVLLVVVYHLDTMWPDGGARLLTGGYLGVDLFLALSGFLITTLLAGEHAAQGVVDLRGFARRRVQRLLPAMVSLLGVLTAIAVTDQWLAGRSIYNARELLAASAWLLTFTSNWAIVLDHGLGPIGHSWSIGLEAQFYVVWGVALAVTLRRRRATAALSVALAGVILVAAWRWISFDADPADVWSHYVSALTRLDAPLIGAVAGICFARGWTRRLEGRGAEACLLAGLGGLLTAAVYVQPFEPALFRGGFTLVAVAAAVAVLGAVHSGPCSSGRILRSRPLVIVGCVSYSLYLWHLPVFVLVGREASELSRPVRCLVGVVIAGTLAWMSYRYVEQPFLRRRHGSRRPLRWPPAVGDPAGGPNRSTA